MEVLQFTLVLFLFNLTQNRSQGFDNEDLFKWFDTLQQPSNDIPIYWDGAEPSLEPPSLEPPSLEPPSLEPPSLEPSPSLQEITWSDSNEAPINRHGKEPALEETITLEKLAKKFVKYYKKGEYTWPDLKYTIRRETKWNNFCLTMWQKWRTQEDASLFPYCLHTCYIVNKHNNYGVNCSKYTNTPQRCKADLLGCYCEYRVNPKVPNITIDHENMFFLARKSISDYFILQKESINNPRCKTLFVTGYITGVNYDWE